MCLQGLIQQEYIFILTQDLPGYLQLKERQWGQGSAEELKEKDFKAELLKK